MAELADAQDLKSCGTYLSYRFDSGLRHHVNIAGTVKLAGVEEEDIFSLACELLQNKDAYDTMAHAVNPYGDGHACRRIADAIEWHFGLRETPPEEF